MRKEREINKSAFLTGCFSLRSKDALRREFWTEVVFLIKIFNFYQKNNLSPKNRFLGRLLSVAKNSQ